MEQTWLDAFGDENLSLDDIERSVRYAKDLTKGLATIKKFPQGVTVFGSARLNPNNKFYKKAYELGAKLAKSGHPVITGGGPGIMEAANRGAFENGGRSIGLNIHLDTEQDLNKYTTDSMEFHYFFARKVMLTFSAKVYVFFPGGFGTLDEFSEILELKHTAKIPDVPIFLFGRVFWQGLDDWFAHEMTSWHLIETGEPNEFSEMPVTGQPQISPNSANASPKDSRENQHILPKSSRAADQNLVHNARELYILTDDINDIIAKANEVESHNIENLIKKSGAQPIRDFRGKVF